MSKDSLKRKINDTLVESYLGMFEDFDKYVMQNHVLNARQKLEILFMMFADKVEKNLDDETKYRLAVVVEELEKEVYEPLKTPSRPWGEMSRLQKETIAQHLNSGQTVKFTETLPCWVECVVTDSYRSVSSTRWSSGLYYWIV